MTSLSPMCGGLRLSPQRALRPGTWRALFGMRQQYPDCWAWLYASEQIGGWLTRDEGATLFRLARDRTPRRNPVVVELGSFKGRSSVMLAGGLCGKHAPRLYCVDVFGPSSDPSYDTWLKPAVEGDPVPVDEQFRHNTRVCGVGGVVTPVQGYSWDVAKTWSEPINMLFIDANHEYEAVVRDIETWAPFLVQGGVILFHDVNDNWPGTKRAFEERIIGPQYSDTSKVDSLAWSVKL